MLDGSVPLVICYLFLPDFQQGLETHLYFFTLGNAQKVEKIPPKIVWCTLLFI